ncbi:MAG: polysaccharide pyruvyl transferase family protein [Actinomycetota bacterium]|nr:polysaccharide pyruvyl transferase family protein [Actinomycetota bacterium]
MTDLADRSRNLTIGVLGSYGGLNIGDEAILTCVLRCLRTLRPSARIVVFTRNSPHGKHYAGGTETVTWEGVGKGPVLEAVAELDLLILGGGGVLYDREARRYLQLVAAAQDRDIPTFGYAVGAGPLQESEDCAIVRTTLNRMTDLVVRDEESKLVLEDVGVDRKITVTADPALLLPREEFTYDSLVREGIPTDARLVAMSVREPGRAAERLDEHTYHALLAEVADFLTHRLDAHVVFIPMERQDISHSHAVLSQMDRPDRGRVLNDEYSPSQILGFMDHVDLAVGMRLHFLIFAALAGVPFFPLPYAGKVFDFARSAGAATLRGVTREQAGLLLAEVDRLWDEYPERRNDVCSRVEKLRSQSRATCERCRAVVEWVESGSPAQYSTSV